MTDVALKPHQWSEILCRPCWEAMKRSVETAEQWAPCETCRPKVEEIMRSNEPKYEWLQRLPFPPAGSFANRPAAPLGSRIPEAIETLRKMRDGEIRAVLEPDGINATGPILPREHPAPWRWELDERSTVLRDAKGAIIMTANFNGYEAQQEHARAATAAAPRMEALLRGFIGGDPRPEKCVNLGDNEAGPPCGTCVVCERNDARALLAELDAAKAPRSELHAKFEEIATYPQRRVITEPDGGLREETDAEFRARLLAAKGGG